MSNEAGGGGYEIRDQGGNWRNATAGTLLGCEWAVVRTRDESLEDLGAVELCATGGITERLGAAKVFGNVERSKTSYCRCSRTYSGVHQWYTLAGNRRRNKAVNGVRGLVGCRRGELQLGGDGVS